MTPPIHPPGRNAHDRSQLIQAGHSVQCAQSGDDPACPMLPCARCGHDESLHDGGGGDLGYAVPLSAEELAQVGREALWLNERGRRLLATVRALQGACRIYRAERDAWARFYRARVAYHQESDREQWAAYEEARQSLEALGIMPGGRNDETG